MSGDAIHTAETRCLRLVTLAENQAKEQRKTLQEEIKHLQALLASKEDAISRDTKENAHALQAYTDHLVDALKVFEARHKDFCHVMKEVSRKRGEQESISISHMKDAVSDFYMSLRNVRKRKFVKTLRDAGLGTQFTEITEMAVAEEEDLPFSMQAVMQYLLGAMEALHQQGLRIEGCAQSLVVAADERRKGFLLQEERALFSSSIKALSSPFVPGGWGEEDGVSSSSPGSSPLTSRRSASPSISDLVSPQAIAVVLLQRLCDDRETRQIEYVECVQKASKLQQRTLHDGLNKMNDHMEQLLKVVTGTPMLEPLGERPYASPTTSPGLGDANAPSPTRSKWGAVRGNLVGVSSQANPLTPTKGGFAAVVSAMMSKKKEERLTAAGAQYASRATDLRDFVFRINSLDDHIITQVVDQHVDDYAAVHGEYSTQMEQLARRCFAEREVQIFQNTTVFSLDSLSSELSHREVVSRVLKQHQEASRRSYECDITRLQESIADVQAAVVKLRRENTELLNTLNEKDREIETLQSVAEERAMSSDTQILLQKELRIIHYEVNEGSFGESWQESMLKLRERILSEVQHDNLRFVARVKTLLKQNLSDDEQMEQLYEARMVSALKELEDDNKRRAETTERRHAIELQACQDSWQSRLEDLRQDHAKQLDDLRNVYHSEYEKRVDDLNEMYDARIRKMNLERTELESLFDTKMFELRQTTREKENEMEARAAKRFAEMDAHFESLSDDLRTRFAEREKILDREKLLVQANFETKVNDKVTQIRTEMVGVSNRLQDSVIDFITQQRETFEEFREAEMARFAECSHTTQKMSSREHAEARRNQLKLQDRAISELKAAHQEEFAVFTRQMEELAATQARNFDERLAEVKANSEEVLRCTQELRVEQDEKFWNECHNELIAANRLLIEEKNRLEGLLQARYASLIDRCNEFLQKDISAARASFESEQATRQKHFHRYVEYYHCIQLVLEQALWEEEAQRNCIERDHASVLFNLRVIREEEKRNVQFCEMLDDNPFTPIGVVKLEELREIREDYEARLLDKQRFIANVTRDSLSSVENFLRNSHQQYLHLHESLDRSLLDVSETLQEKFKAYYTARSFVIEHEIRRIAEFAEGVVTKALRGPNVKAISNVGGGGDAAGGQGGSGGAHWSEEVRVMEYFVSMKHILTQAMKEYEDKLMTKFDDSERQKHDTFQRMHLQYLDASGAMMKQLEELKLANDCAEVSMQQAKTRLALQNNEQNKARILCDDLVEMLERHTGQRLSQRQGGRTAAAVAGYMSPDAVVPVPMRTLSDLAALRERVYCDEYTAYSKGQLLLQMQHAETTAANASSAVADADVDGGDGGRPTTPRGGGGQRGRPTTPTSNWK